MECPNCGKMMIEKGLMPNPEWDEDRLSTTFYYVLYQCLKCRGQFYAWRDGYSDDEELFDYDAVD